MHDLRAGAGAVTISREPARIPVSALGSWRAGMVEPQAPIEACDDEQGSGQRQFDEPGRTGPRYSGAEHGRARASIAIT